MRLFVTVVFFFMVFGFSLDGAHAQERFNYVGAGSGWAVVTSGDGGNSFTYSVRVGTELMKDESGIFTLGAWVGSLSNENTYSGTTASERITGFLGEILSQQAFDSGLYFGARAGFGLVSADITGGSTDLTATDNGFLWGAVVGYEIPVNEKLGVWFDMSYLTLTSGELDFAGIGTVEYDSAQAIALQVGVSTHW
jgi:hypothetical protein